MAFDPNTASVDEVKAKLEKANDTERQRILTAEQTGKRRKTILEPFGIDADARVDGAGRALYPWEVAPGEHVVAVPIDDSPEVMEARKKQAEYDEMIAAAQAGDQGGSTAPGVGTPAAGGGDTGTTTVATTA